MNTRDEVTITGDELRSMTPDEFNALPFGVICLDVAGTVIAYNTTESLIARRKVESVIGRNFFAEVAPCADTESFGGRFRQMCAESVATSTSFDYEFDFPWGRCAVRIRLTFDSSRNCWIFVTKR